VVLEEDLIFTDYIPDDELNRLYSGAAAFLFPSLYEGFGIPILEAFACGTPVITSNCSSLPEVAGRAALLVNPEKEEEIGDAMSRITSSESLQEELKAKGFEQIKKFSWNKTAAKTLEVYQEVVNARGRTAARFSGY